MNLENFFNPKTVAVIGASSDKNKVGFALMSNLVKSGGRKIFPISISEKEILGMPTLPSILDVSAEIDLAVIAVRADLTPKILEECGRKKIKNVVVISAGFKEVGQSGAELENKIAEIAKWEKINLLGPNCLGVLNATDDFNCTFASGNPPEGSIAFLSQSGALGTALLDMALTENVGFSKFISLGNEAGMTEMDFLKFLADDEKTKSILIYLEKLSDGAGFMRLAGEITKTKPIVVLKAGRSNRGAKAVSSHTGSLAPDDAIFSAACKQAGMISVNSIREFFNMAKLFQLGIGTSGHRDGGVTGRSQREGNIGIGTTKPLQRICILTNGGGPSVVATDLVDLSQSLSLAEISDKTKEKLRKVLPPMAAVGNPIDIIGDALADRFENALEILAEEKETDAILFLVTPQMMTEMKKTAELVLKYFPQKPIIPVFLGGPQIAPAWEVLRQNKMVNFTFPSDAILALDQLSFDSPDGSLQGKVPLKTPIRGGDYLQMMNFEKMSNLLSDYSISLSGVFVKDKFDIVPLLKKLKLGNFASPNSPRSELGLEKFAMKVISEDVVHKTEAGAVALNLQSADEAEKFWDEWKNKSKTKIEGMLIQPMSTGREVIIGMKRDATFGPTILFGLGGILAEAIKDTSLKVTPVSKDEALQMMSEIKGAGILQGLRGEKPVDFDALAEIIVNLSRLAVDNPEIKEIDLNPVMATENGATVVDARIMI